MAVGRVNLLSDVGHRQAKFLLVFWGAYHTTTTTTDNKNKNRKRTVQVQATSIYIEVHICITSYVSSY